MMAAHTARLIPFSDRPAWARTVLLYEPVIPSLFLLLVGWSLSLSFGAARGRGEAAGAWYARQARRAIGLWAISILFFVAEYGVRLPDALFTGGILAVIAYSILFVGAILTTGRAATPLLATLFATGAFVFWRLDAASLNLYPLTMGSAPLLPMMLFALAGALVRTLVGAQSVAAQRGPRLARALPAAVAVAGIAGAALAAWLIARHGAEVLFTKPFGRGEAGRTLAASLLPAREALHVGFYNLRPSLAAACLGIQMAGLAALALAGAALRNVPERVARVAFLLGRHALATYVGHLAILAAVVTAFGRQPLTAISGTATWAGLILVCQTGAFLLGKKKGV